jgi:ABC-type transporter Mla MlaB component
MPGGWRALSGAAVSGSRVIVDLEGLAFLDCSGLSAVVSAWGQARQAGGELRLAAPGQLVLRLLCLTGVAGLLPVFASVDQAANGDGRFPAARWLAGGQADGAAPPGNGGVSRVGDDVSPAGRGRLPRAMCRRWYRHSTAPGGKPRVLTCGAAGWRRR